MTVFNYLVPSKPMMVFSRHKYVFILAVIRQKEVLLFSLIVDFYLFYFHFYRI